MNALNEQPITVYGDGKNIRDGSSSGGRTLIKISDAAKQIGTSATGPSTALVWWFFAK